MNDKTDLVKEAKTTKQVVVVGPPIKKRLGEMLSNQVVDRPITRLTRYSHYASAQTIKRYAGEDTERIRSVSGQHCGRYAGLKYGYARVGSPLSSADPPESSRVRFEQTAYAYTARSTRCA